MYWIVFGFLCLLLIVLIIAGWYFAVWQNRVITDSAGKGIAGPRVSILLNPSISLVPNPSTSPTSSSLNSSPNSSLTSFKRPSLAIIMASTVNGRKHVQYSTAVNEKYAKKWGYGFIFVDFKNHPELRIEGRAAQWHKMAVMKHYLSYDYDYIMWIDDDAMIIDHDKNFDDFIYLSEGADVIICRDSGPGCAINTGNFMLKNTIYTHHVMDEIINSQDDSLKKFYTKAFHEQSTLQEIMIEPEIPGCRWELHEGTYYSAIEAGYPIRTKHVCIFSEYAMNNMNSCFLVHLMGWRNPTRATVFRQYHDILMSGKALDPAYMKTRKTAFPWDQSNIFIYRPRLPVTNQAVVAGKGGGIIHQSYETYGISKLIEPCIENLRSYHNFHYYLHTCTQRRQCIKSHESQLPVGTLAAYNNLNCYEHQVNLWSYCYLYLYGGLFISLKTRVTERANFQSIDLTKIVVYYDEKRQVYYNDILGGPPQHPLFLACITRVIFNTLGHVYGNDECDVTGSGVLTKVIKDMEASDLYTVTSQEFNILPDSNNEVKELIKGTGRPHHRQLWLDKNVYKENKVMRENTC